VKCLFLLLGSKHLLRSVASHLTQLQGEKAGELTVYRLGIRKLGMKRNWLVWAGSSRYFVGAAQPVAQADAAIAAVKSGGLGRVGGGLRRVSGQAAAQLSSTRYAAAKEQGKGLDGGFRSALCCRRIWAVPEKGKRFKSGLRQRMVSVKAGCDPRLGF
jgi:hypothetical protein